ncbi:MAG: hypothetical protein IT449_05520 [Phycisphaerales bacterium]|nr:hypothetical protein [Phycisphaerales bacterium]
MRFGFWLSGLLALTLATSVTWATDYTWKTDASSRSWTSGGNWSGGSGYPDDENDTATIPVGTSDEANYPLLNASGAITIKSFKVLNTLSNHDTVVLELGTPGSGSCALKIKDPDGLDPGQGAIKLNKSTELWHLGGGVMSVWGDMVFDSAGASAAQRPRFVLGNGTTLYVCYKDDASIAAGFKSVGEPGGLIRGEVGQTDLEESLILRPDMKGSFAVDVAMVSLGDITTVDGDSNTANTIRLSCLPKIIIGEAYGSYPAVYLAGDAGKLGTLIIDAVTCLRAVGTVSVVVEDYGVLKVNRHFVMLQDFTIESGGRVEVKAKILFAIGGTQPICGAPIEP